MPVILVPPPIVLAKNACAYTKPLQGPALTAKKYFENRYHVDPFRAGSAFPLVGARIRSPPMLEVEEERSI